MLMMQENITKRVPENITQNQCCDENDNNAEEGLNLIRLFKNQGYDQVEKYLEIYEKMKINQSLKIQLFFIGQMIKNQDMSVRINEKYIKIFCDNNILSSQNFIKTLIFFPKVYIELTYKSDFYEDAFNQIIKHKDFSCFKNINLLISVSPSVNTIDYCAFRGYRNSKT